MSAQCRSSNARKARAFPDNLSYHLDCRPEQLLLVVLALVVATQVWCHRRQQGPDRPAPGLELIGELIPGGDVGLNGLEQQLEWSAYCLPGGLAGEDGDGFGQPGSDLSDQSGLAHPRLAGEQRHAGVVVGRHHGEQSLQFGATPHHRRAEPGASDDHAPQVTTHRGLSGLGRAGAGRGGRVEPCPACEWLNALRPGTRTPGGGAPR